MYDTKIGRDPFDIHPDLCHSIKSFDCCCISDSEFEALLSCELVSFSEGDVFCDVIQVW